ncbi:MAG: nicotinamide N-methyase [Rhizobiales bacterium 65-9]|nr:methyltransferase [Hyphomicrobiales bacterium]OJY32878.1 MAG: nicotinamide N-methyase [Rhizobiales bacterium 65-9]
MTAAAILDRAAFIRANTRLLPVPHAPAIRLHLADEATALWEKTEEELGAIGLPPPFWAFAWAGGQALARYLLDNPAIARGRRVLDVASGSGLVAIAAARAGAAAVLANDIDAFALAAIPMNAEANGVSAEVLPGDLIGRPVDADIVCAGDVFYERDMAARMADWLAGLVRNGVTALVGDPGRSYLPRERLELLAEYQVPVTRALEDAEIKRACVWRFRG